MNKNILVVAKDASIADHISSIANELSICVDACTDGMSGFKKALSNEYNLIILEYALPFVSGIEICRHFRLKNDVTPIIILSATGIESHKLLALENGADEYLEEPISKIELQIRVRGIFRRLDAIMQSFCDSASKVMEFKGMRVDIDSREVQVNDEPIELTVKEFDLLLCLIRASGAVLSREQLVQAVWGRHELANANLVNSYINRLRSKIEPDPAHPVYVQTVWGVGYKFVREHAESNSPETSNAALCGEVPQGVHAMP